MNERIRELIKSIGIIPEDEHYDVAELIVLECANFIAPLGDWCGGHGEPHAPSTRECSDKLKKHFGIK